MKKYKPNYTRVFNKVLGIWLICIATLSSFVYSPKIDWLDVILFIVFGAIGVSLFRYKKKLF